jgi:hypothetical protein
MSFIAHSINRFIKILILTDFMFTSILAGSNRALLDWDYVHTCMKLRTVLRATNFKHSSATAKCPNYWTNPII